MVVKYETHSHFTERNRMKKQVIIKILSVLTALLCVCPTVYTALRANAAYENEAAVFTYLTGVMGLNNAAACGIMANIEMESGFDPHAGGDGGSSYGICQWHASRFTALRNYCYSHGLDYTTLYGQLCFLNYELENEWPRTMNYLRGVENSADGAYDAGYYWCYHFEVPAGYASGVSVSRGNRAMTVYWPVYGAAAEPTPLEKAAAASNRSTDSFMRAYARVGDLIRAVLSMLTTNKA